MTQLRERERALGSELDLYKAKIATAEQRQSTAELLHESAAAETARVKATADFQVGKRREQDLSAQRASNMHTSNSTVL